MSKQMRGRSSQRRERGFTLLEAMIALMIVALALPAMITLIITQLDGSAVIRDKTYAYWVAENQLARIRLLQQQKMQKRLPDYKVPEKDAGTVDLAGLRWQWQQKTIAMDTLPEPGFKRIEITVRLLGVADGPTLGRSVVDEDKPAMALLTGYISDPETTQQL
ncbi:MAG: type II secretion system protein GspI [Cellvibrio sp. 79]|nr:MAG: type II secretion system protein GspI [Cellvibrio sp. 79]